jgi:hypothetical protein
MIFKLLAIRPLIGCHEKYTKVLKDNTIYRFFNDYEFTVDDAKDVIRVDHKPLNNVDLYSIKKQNNTPLFINISAVVGKNGSGKSSLIELLFAALYNLSVKYRIITYNTDAEEETQEEEIADERTAKYDSNKQKKVQYAKNLNVEIYYALNNEVICLYVNTTGTNTHIHFKQIPFYQNNNSSLIRQAKNLKPSKLLINELLFYSISINYSIYSLNSKQIGTWVAYLFHKNDGYQTPLVINPFRKTGNINIETENDLVTQRLLANLLEPIPVNAKNSTESSLRNLAPGKIASTLILKLNHKKVENYRQNNELNKVLNTEECISKLYYRYTGSYIRYIPEEPLLIFTKFYLENKLVKICTLYERYKKFLKKDRFININRLVDRICRDSSHITFKLKQALNFLKHQHIVNPLGFRETQEYPIPLEDLSKEISRIKSNNKSKNQLKTIELIPPSLFDIEIKLSDGTPFNDLSSGEKQKIYSISSIIYHLINVNSVHDIKYDVKEEEPFKYRHINILFDELELYFHPDLQRTFINDFLDYLGKMSIENTKHILSISITFLTHSPFILSDIPNTNILRLERGAPQDLTPTELTFGANIHDLLAQDFFMTSSFIGEHAKQKIQEVIKRLNAGPKTKDKNPDEILSIINLIGESFLREKLRTKFYEKYPEKFSRRQRINELETELTRLKNDTNLP